MAPDARDRRAAHELRNAQTILWALLELQPPPGAVVLVERADLEAIDLRLGRALRLLEARHS